MSRNRRFTWERAILTSDLPAQAKALAFVLANHMDPDGVCFLSNDTLAAESSLSKTRMGEYKRLLRRGGWIEVRNGQGGRPGRVPTYVASFPLASTVPADGKDLAGPDPLTAQRVPAHGEGPCPPTGTEQSLDQTREHDSTWDEAAYERSIDAWMALDWVCREIDAQGFPELPRRVRREAHRYVLAALEVSSLGAVLDRLKPPERVRSKAGLVLSMARSLADDPPGDLVALEGHG